MSQNQKNMTEILYNKLKCRFGSNLSYSEFNTSINGLSYHFNGQQRREPKYVNVEHVMLFYI